MVVTRGLWMTVNNTPPQPSPRRRRPRQSDSSTLRHDIIKPTEELLLCSQSANRGHTEQTIVLALWMRAKFMAAPNN